MAVQPVLNYQSKRPERLPWWRRNVLLWAIICWNGYGFAILGPVFVIVGIVSFFVDLGDMLHMNGEPVRTVNQKIIWILSNLVFGALGIWFVAWHCRSMRPQPTRRSPNAPGTSLNPEA